MASDQAIFVAKRDGRKQEFDRTNIVEFLRKLAWNLSEVRLDLDGIAKVIETGVYDGVTTVQISNLVAETVASRVVVHYDHSVLAARVAVAALHKQTHGKFSHVVSDLYNNISEFTGEHLPLVSKNLFEVVTKYMDTLDDAIDYRRDFEYQYFGFKTLERAYLLKLHGKIVERPQHLLMRTAVGIHGWDIPRVLDTYHLMAERYFTHASPTLFNAGTQYPQMSSCFLLGMVDDSINGIYETLTRCANISKSAGGIGLHINNIRAAGSFITGTNGTSNGLVPMLRVFNDTARFVDQGGNRRPGAIAIYIEPWHADIFDVLDLKKNHGKEENRARDLFYALWIPDLFMQKVEAGGDWCLFSPSEAKGLEDVYGQEFEDLYNKYVEEGRQRKTIKAQKLWYAILQAQTETGVPYMVYKDACNRKTNQKNLGTIKSSNLCAEIVEYSSKDEIAVCNLASVALSRYVEQDSNSAVAWYDFQKLHKIVKKIVYNLNRIIDVNWYPLPEAKKSNLRHRPIAVGVQGLADTFMALRLPFESEEAKKLNISIFETIYHGAVEASIDLAKKYGPYETYEGSPASEGKLQFDLWNRQPSDLWDWEHLKERMKQYGLRNSLLVAPMPTASTSNILGLNECFEPYTSNMYTRRVTSGEFQIVNQWMMKDLIDIGLWDEDMRNEIIKNNGSITNIARIPETLKKLYKTVWEISQRTVIDMAADRGAFIDQSQSLNIYMREVTPGKLTSMHFYGWKKGLKTGMYYLRTQAAAAPIQFTVDQERLKRSRSVEVDASMLKELKRPKYEPSIMTHLGYHELESRSLTPDSIISTSGHEDDSCTTIETRDTPVVCTLYSPNDDRCDMCSG